MGEMVRGRCHCSIDTLLGWRGVRYTPEAVGAQRDVETITRLNTVITHDDDLPEHRRDSLHSAMKYEV